MTGAEAALLAAKRVKVDTDDARLLTLLDGFQALVEGIQQELLVVRAERDEARRLHAELADAVRGGRHAASPEDRRRVHTTILERPVVRRDPSPPVTPEVVPVVAPVLAQTPPPPPVVEEAPQCQVCKDPVDATQAFCDVCFPPRERELASGEAPTVTSLPNEPPVVPVVVAAPVPAPPPPAPRPVFRPCGHCGEPMSPTAPMFALFHPACLRLIDSAPGMSSSGRAYQPKVCAWPGCKVKYVPTGPRTLYCEDHRRTRLTQKPLPPDPELETVWSGRDTLVSPLTGSGLSPANLRGKG